MSSIFSRIISGEIPGYILYQNDYVAAFLDIHPISLGHTLVVPKMQVDHFVDLPEPYYSAVFQAAKILALAIQKATNCRRVGAMIEGFDVPHMHYHLVPLFQPEDLHKPRLNPDSKSMLQIQSQIIHYLSAT